ncbi:MAG TPA: ATP-binding protein [Anaerolineales bacterium]|nr:ATP-binding protein [Anaerolineales bacterium]
MDIAENSLTAQATRIELAVEENIPADRLHAVVADNGRGMDAALLARIADPFTTSRTTRKVGLGIPLLKAAAEAANGCFSIQSAPGQGARVEVEFQHTHIDRMPLGDLSSTFLTLLVAHPQIDWRFLYRAVPASAAVHEFEFESRPVVETLGGVSLTEPEILAYLREMFRSGVGEPANQISISMF